jgi:hypothetical protein
MNDDSSFNVMSSSQFMLGSIPVPDLFFSLITVTGTSYLVPRFWKITPTNPFTIDALFGCGGYFVHLLWI